MLLVDSPAAQLLGSSRTGRGVKYKTVVLWQMGLFSIWHSTRIISQIFVPVESVSLDDICGVDMQRIDLHMIQCVIV